MNHWFNAATELPGALECIWYRLMDSQDALKRSPHLRGMYVVPWWEAKQWNQQGWGIYEAVQRFSSTERRIANLDRILAWAVDIDHGTKAEQRARIAQARLVPSRIVETKRGYQVYYFAKDAMSTHWNAIVLDRLVPFFGADENARDLARVLRVPGFYHMKNPSEPFLVRQVASRRVAYTEMQMAMAFPSSAKVKREKEAHRAEDREHRGPCGDTFFDKLFRLDCEQGLMRLSGTPIVNGEIYSFKLNTSGTKQIRVNDVEIPAWIDLQGRIGSLSRGGPDLFSWCMHEDLRNTKKQAYDALVSIFTELGG